MPEMDSESAESAGDAANTVRINTTYVYATRMGIQWLRNGSVQTEILIWWGISKRKCPDVRDSVS